MRCRIKYNKYDIVQSFKVVVSVLLKKTVSTSTTSPSPSLLCTFSVTADDCLHILSNLWAAFHIRITLICYTESKVNVVQRFPQPLATWGRHCLQFFSHLLVITLLFKLKKLFIRQDLFLRYKHFLHITISNLSKPTDFARFPVSELA
jgi:hypothetical protein